METKLSRELLKAVRKKAVGYTAEESVEEYGVCDGEAVLQKRKITQKEVPPDLSAVKLLLEWEGSDPYEQMTEEQLEREKIKLLQQLKEKYNETD